MEHQPPQFLIQSLFKVPAEHCGLFLARIDSYRYTEQMLDIKFIKENPDLIKEAVRKKRINFNLDELLTLEEKRLEALSLVESLRAEQNSVSDNVASEKDSGKRNELISRMRILKESLKEKEEKLKEVMQNWQTLMLRVPNVPDMSVPEGDSDAGNTEVRVWGEIPKFTFEPKSHTEIMQGLDLADFERGAKVAGFRGYFLKNEATSMSFGIWQIALENLIKDGFTPMIVPSLVRKENLYGSGYLPQGEEDLYKTQDGEYLAGTGEVATMGYYMDEVVPVEKLPLKFVSFSPCFRREAGAHGKDVKGIFRVHEFFKLEQVILCEASHEESVKYHELLTANAENLLKQLEIPHHVVINCGADLGLGQVKKYDIEVWTPSENKYRESHSSSYFHDFQTRRLNIRYKDKEGKMRFTHSLNNTLIATPRIIAAILENNQQEDGSIRVPEVLQKYVGTKVISKK